MLTILPALLSTSVAMLLLILSQPTLAAESAPRTPADALEAQRQPSSFSLPRSEVFELADPVSGRLYDIALQWPKEASALKSAPQIYVLDAPYAFPIVAGAMRFPVNSGVMTDALVVGIGYAQGDRGQASRVRDYTPTRDDNWKLTTGGAAAHADFIEKVLFPEIARRCQASKFNTSTTIGADAVNGVSGQPPRRIFIGNSLGGLFGGWLLQARPQLFDDYILGSPSVWFDNETLLKTEVMNHANKPGRVFISVGAAELPPTQRHDMVAGARKLRARLDALPSQQLKIKYLEIPEADHSMAFPTSAIHGLSWLLATADNN